MAGYWPRSFLRVYGLRRSQTPKHDKLYLGDKARIPTQQTTQQNVE